MQSHGFAEFQCLHCETKDNDVVEMRRHMSNDHPSQFLFIGSRQSAGKNVYIGESCDFSQFQFSICSNPEALNSMDPLLKSHRQHTSQWSFWSKNQVATPYLGSIPPNSFKESSGDFFITYENYVEMRLRSQMNESMMANTPEVFDTVSATSETIYKCISDLAASEIARIEDSVYTNLICDCGERVDIPDEDLMPYLNHLAKHPQCSKDHTDCEDKIIAHRLIEHANSAVAYLKVQIDSGIEVQKLVRCVFQCNIEMCGSEFETKAATKQHFALVHDDCTFDARIKQTITVIHSNDSNQAFATRHIENGQFRLSQLLYCASSICSSKNSARFVGTRREAILHHSEVHGLDFEICVKQKLCNHLKMAEELNEVVSENASPYRMLLFECIKCETLFDSPDAVREHNESEHDGEVQFMARKLLQCRHCKSICLWKWMGKHHKGHTNLPSTSANKTNCIFCKGSPIETFTNAQMARFQVNEIPITDCLLTPACCEQKQLKPFQLVLHLVSCMTFNCDDCSKSIGNLHEIHRHYRDKHDKSTEDIVKEVQHIKNLSRALEETRIRFPSGLVMIKFSIDATELGQKFDDYLKQNVIIERVWPVIADFIDISSERKESLDNEALFEMLKTTSLYPAKVD